MIEVRPATRDDLDALTSLWPAVQDKHVRANPDYHKALAPGAARRLSEGLFAREECRPPRRAGATGLP